MEDLDGLMAVEKRLAEATGPDRDLDAELCAAVGFKVKRSEGFGEPIDSEWLYCVTKDGRGWNRIPAYTSSIDAALTSLPEGWAYAVASCGVTKETEDKCYATIFCRGKGRVVEHQLDATAQTAPTALCSAAVKARILLASTAHKSRPTHD